MVLARRDFLAGGIAAGAAAVTLAKGLQSGHDVVDPRVYGAVGNGVSDDTAALEKALGSALDRGLPLDGGASQYAIHGNVVVAGRSQPWIRSLRLRQLAPSNDRKTLFFKDCQQIRIDQLTIDLGNAAAVGYFNESGGLWIDGGSGHQVSNVDAYGDGKNSLIGIWNTSRSTYANLRAHDAKYDARAAKDDVVQGIFLCRNQDCLIQSPRVANLHGNASRRFPTRYSRGIAACGNARLRIIDAQVSDVDQGIDLTGSDGNLDSLIQSSHVERCCSVGIKLANSAVRCTVSGSIAECCGLAGFLASGPAAPGLPHKTQDCDFVACTSHDAGYNGFKDSAPSAGFRVERNQFDREYPMGIRFIDCEAADRQTPHSMEFGFYENVDAGQPARRPNELIRCRSSGHLKAEQRWST